jgi:hypothetical protein
MNKSLNSGTVLVPKITKTTKNEANINNPLKMNSVTKPFIMAIHPGRNREGGRTVGSGKVATIVE